jgi:hypothetical protein
MQFDILEPHSLDPRPSVLRLQRQETFHQTHVISNNKKQSKYSTIRGPQEGK